MCEDVSTSLLSQLDLRSSFRQRLFHCVCLNSESLHPVNHTDMLLTATIFRAARKRPERNVRPACGPAKIISQQDRGLELQVFPIVEKWKSLQEREREREQAQACLTRSQQEAEQDPWLVFACAGWRGSLMTSRPGAAGCPCSCSLPPLGCAVVLQLQIAAFRKEPTASRPSSADACAAAQP